MFFFFNDTATTEIYTLSLHDALPIYGFNDDLFGVDEAVRYYNKVRARHPDAPISMFHLDFGHNPRAGAVSAADRAALHAAEDRKSTRLNSSHANISYAVFCLKKKITY